MRFAVGVDVGGTKILGVLVDETGKILKEKKLPTLPDEGGDAVLKRIGKIVSSLSTRKDLLVGISFPGHLKEGLLVSCPNIPSLEGKPLLQLLFREIKRPMVLENDANCFAYAEEQLGAAQGCKNVVGLIVGTGIGGGLIVDGHILKGKQGGAGEIGHIPFKEHTVEWYAAGPGIVRSYLSHGGNKEKTQIIFEKKNPAARLAVQSCIDALAYVTEILCHTIDPEIIVLGGGVSNAPIIKDIQKALDAKGFTCKVARSELGEVAGALGAAELALGK